MTQTALQVSQVKELQSIIDRVERLNEEREGLGADIAEILMEAKQSGYCPKTIRKVIALRKLSKAEREESEALLETYVQAIGWASTPLARAADRPLLTVV